MELKDVEIEILKVYAKLKSKPGEGAPIQNFLARIKGHSPGDIQEGLASLNERGLVKADRMQFPLLTEAGAGLIYGPKPAPTLQDYSVRELQAHRASFLKALYKAVVGSPSAMVLGSDIAVACGLPNDLVRPTRDFLKGAGLIKPQSLGGHISITPYGIHVVESWEAEKSDRPEIQGASSSVHNTIGELHIHGQNNQIGNINSNQINSGNSNKEVIKQFLKKSLEVADKLDLSGEDRSELEDQIDTAAALIETRKPNQGFLRESLSAIQRILEGGAGEVLGAGVLSALPTASQVFETIKDLGS